MQDRYAGDVGDFGKLALLRALGVGRRLGVCWYRTDGASESNNDGRHLRYLDEPHRFRSRDAELFDTLSAYVRLFRSGDAARDVAALEKLGVLPSGPIFHRELCPPAKSARTAWSVQMIAAMSGANLVFLDPDNGFETKTPGSKSATFDEILKLRAEGRALVIYHHATRRKGGAREEYRHQTARLKERGISNVCAVLLRPYSPRFFFLVDADTKMKARLDAFAMVWGEDAERFGE